MVLRRQTCNSLSASSVHLPVGYHSRCSRARPVSTRAFGGSNWSAPFDDTTKRALREAGELLSEAQELAKQQTLSDLMSSWAADTAPQQHTHSHTETSSSTTATSVAVPSPQAPQTAAASSLPEPSSAAALEAFWCEQGLQQQEAQQLLQEISADAQLAATCCNTQLLSQKLASLRRVLPGLDVVQLVARVPQLLQVPSSSAVQVLVALVNALPGCDVVNMVGCQPRLLLLDGEGLPQQLQAVISKLQALHPSHLVPVVAGIIEENPELVLRMPYYLGDDVRLIDDLPIEIQNMMVLGDHGVGYLYRYWNKQTDKPQKDEGSSSSEY